MKCPRVSLVGPIENGIQATVLIGTVDLNTGRYTPPDLREWKHWLDRGWVVEMIPEPTP